nr:DNA RNA helicase C terminal [Hymenolepis microstoma]
MKKSKHVSGEMLSSLCPESLDLFTLEPFNSLAFLDSLIDEKIPIQDTQPPISFPDLSLPLVSFDAHVPRNLETGECEEGDVDCTCSGNLFTTNKSRQDENSLSASSRIDDIIDSLFLGWSNNGNRMDLDEIFLIPPLQADVVLNRYLSLCSDAYLPISAHDDELLEFVPKETKLSAEIEEVQGLEVDEGKVDPETAATLEMRLRQARNPDTKAYAVLESSGEKLPPLRELVPEPAFEWPFELDTFQKQAIVCLENNRSVLVAAHTSAGKTVVAEYACAMCKRRGSRAIYTSPIKALSNQKFRDFRDTFGEDVGLLTGDIKVAPKSSILVMTTEILHNMLCNSADTIRDLEVVIMDEVHYMNNKERGHVWEQLMILLPQYVILVLLSATLPNAMDFADWLGRIRGGTTIHVCQTLNRPVPLEHYLYTGCDTATRENTYLVVDKDSRFSREGYLEAKASLIKPKVTKKSNVSSETSEDAEEIARKEAKKKPKSQYKGGKANTPGRQNYMPKTDKDAYDRSTKTATTVWVGLIRMLKEHELTPVIVFCFSRARINSLVQCLGSVDLLNKPEKSEVIKFLRAAVGSRLKGSDKSLAQVILIRSLAVRGIAIHHAGMLPLLKEAVEMLFQRGLVRILFATETFAMGVNMPARCVIFTSLQKHDGSQRRPLTAGEYTQMAGRAGRRGLDTTGTVIIMANNIDNSVMPNDLQLQQMLLGQATRLTSRFKITYSMILYLHRGELQSPQELIRQSFMHAVDLRLELQRKRQVDLLKELIKSSVLDSCTYGALPRLSKTGPVVNISGDQEAKKCFPMDTRCPAYPLDSPEASRSLCVDQIAGFYMACYSLRNLSYACAKMAGEQGSSILEKIFCPGRVVQLQLSPESLRAAAQSTSASLCLTHAGSRLIPNWSTLGVVIEVKRAVGWIMLTVVTWQLPPSPIDDCSKQIGATLEEEVILCDSESNEFSFTPFPPVLMPVYCPESKEDSKSRLVMVTGVPLTSLLAVTNTVVPGATEDKFFSNSIPRDLAQFRQQQDASTLGLEVLVSKKRVDQKESRGSPTKSHLDAVNETLYTAASNVNNLETIPFWMHIGLECPEAEAWMELSQALRSLRCDDNSRFKYMLYDVAVCEDLVAHLNLAHRCLRRSQAVARLEEKLSRNKGALLLDYEARVRVLEKLGFLEKGSQSGCLTRKGRAACEFQQMEVLLAEVLFDGSIIQMPPEDIAALLSCFVCESGMGGPQNQSPSPPQQNAPSTLAANNPSNSRLALVTQEEVKSYENPVEPEEPVKLPITVPEHLQDTVRSMFAKARRLESLQMKYGVLEGESDTQLNAILVGATYAWACNQPFSAIMGLVAGEVAEGHVLRALQRLDELLRHVCAACKGLGDHALASRMDAARVAVHRDMVCAPSLYVADEIAAEASDDSKPEEEEREKES